MLPESSIYTRLCMLPTVYVSYLASRLTVARGGSRISQTGGVQTDAYCDVGVIKSDVTIDFSVDVVRENVHLVTRSA